jgi:hypothetical protein
MIPKTLEGKWEDIALHGSELAGRWVRVTVLDQAEPTKMLDRLLAALISEAEKLSGELPISCQLVPSDPWGEGVLAKFRRQGIKP